MTVGIKTSIQSNQNHRMNWYDVIFEQNHTKMKFKTACQSEIYGKNFEPSSVLGDYVIGSCALRLHLLFDMEISYG